MIRPTARPARFNRPEKNPLVLSTIHSAKGLEWRNVYILNVIERCIPSLNAESDEQIEEERRLLHVAMSRAKKGLELMIPRQAYRSWHGKLGDQHAFTKMTRFIPASIRDSFDCRCRGRGLSRQVATGRRSCGHDNRLVPQHRRLST